MNMARIGILVMAMIGFLSSCSTLPEVKKNGDGEFSTKIVGSWSEGTSPYGVSTFKEDGTYEAKMWATPERQKLIVSAIGKWWIEGRKLYNTWHKVEPPILPTAQEPIVDEIVDISDDVLTLIDSKGEKYTKARVK